MDDPSGSIPRVLILLVLLWISSIAYGYAQAFDNGNFTEPDDDDMSKRALRLRRLLLDPSSLYNTMRAIGTVSIMVLTLMWVPFTSRKLCELMAGGTDVQPALRIFSYVLSGCLLLWIYLGIGVFAPQKIAAQKSERWIRKYTGLICFFIRIFTPVTFLIKKLSHLVIRLFRLDPNADDDDVTEEEVISMVDEGQKKGVFQDSEVEMIHNIFDLNDTDAKDIMTHRKNITALDGSMTLAEALPVIREENHSRFPVYREDIDDLIGILHIRNLLQYIQDPKALDKKLSEIPGLLHKVSYIPETRSIDVLFRNMQQEKSHVVIVIDEYGQTSGLVSMEDILEEIVGNIQDEYDEEEEMIVPCGEDQYLIQGFTLLEDIEEQLDVSFTDEEHETLNGCLIARLDRIPEDGEQFTLQFDGLKFQVLKVENNAIRSVLVSKLPEEKTEDEEEKTKKKSLEE